MTYGDGLLGDKANLRVLSETPLGAGQSFTVDDSVPHEIAVLFHNPLIANHKFPKAKVGAPLID
jgi:hypothetical protein